MRKREETPLAKLRTQFGFAQYDVAGELGISQPLYSLLETGRKESPGFEQAAYEAIRRLVRRQGEEVA